MSFHLPTPESFPAFPYDPPYSIQVDLMRHLYNAIEKKAVTIVESPTGTGKTLSLLCASLTWLADNRVRSRQMQLAELGSADAHDWVVAQTLQRKKRELEDDEREYQRRLEAARKREELARRLARARVLKKPKTSQFSNNSSDEESFLPDDQVDKVDDNLSPAVRALMAKMQKGHSPSAIDEDIEPTCTKIYYASRTHSQLAQILPELRKLKLSPVGMPRSSDGGMSGNGPTSRVLPGKRMRVSEDHEQVPDDSAVRHHTRMVSLASRKQLCINEDIKSKSTNLDEACRKMLNGKNDHRCEFLPPIDNKSRMLDFRDQILASPKDIEDLVNAGRLDGTCPYFGSRRAVPQAELVILPYNLLLHPNSRDALGIDLKDQIVIIDEAHNLVSTLLSLSSVELSHPALSSSLNQVLLYVTKYRGRLSTNHLLHLRRLIMFMEALSAYMVEWRQREVLKGPGEHIEVMSVGELVEKLGRKVENINLLEIVSYLVDSKIARKISNFSDRRVENDSASSVLNMPLYLVESFMLGLTAANEDGRVFFSLIVNNGQNIVQVKYQLLNPAIHFQEVVDTAHAVVLAGGTMSPMSDLVAQLLSHLTQDRLMTFTCGHIIPPSNIQTLILKRGPGGSFLDFKFQKQKDTKMLQELGQIILNFVHIVSGGLVIFLPSYHFLRTIVTIWESNGMMKKINEKKKVFQEPQNSTMVENILAEYAVTINQHSGALLLAVIGAKLSEGLNFSDNLARAVVVVGLPFANLGSVELQERLKYTQKRSHIKGDLKIDAAKELYENMCMNAVNQSIGRAIRHKNDWSSLILIDQRYASSNVIQKLPKWIGEALTVTENFAQVMKCMSIFYNQKK